MSLPEITEDMILECFATARQDSRLHQTAESFVDVEEYESQVMYPEFARWADRAGHPDLSRLFRQVADEEKLHAVWLRELYDRLGVASRGLDTQRALGALQAIRANCDALLVMNPQGVIECALAVAIRVEEREYIDIYPRFRDQALIAGEAESAAVYQRVIDSELRHADWFRTALDSFRQIHGQVPASAFA